ncbi:MAG: SDR family oxidoreductase [Bdellovibrionales bacterium]|nr:SDR family oxidoreductase [Bdellovibrionales bacterium]
MEQKNAGKKVVWITGASSGIGEALAYEYSRQGHFLVLSARREAELKRVLSFCAYPASAKLLPMDLEDIEKLDRVCEAATALFGRIDTVILNGGISQRALALEADFAVTERLMRINFFSSVKIVKNCLPPMISRKSGQIVLVSSLVGKFGTPFRSSYSASKHAIHGYFDSLRAEIRNSGVQVTILCPGFIKTSISTHALVHDGKAQGLMDDAQKNGMEPRRFAQLAYVKVEHGKSEVYIGGREVLGVYLKRFVPSMFERLIATSKVK